MARLSTISLLSVKPNISALIFALLLSIAPIQSAPDSLTDVQIVTELEPDMFPESWRTPRINAQATALAENQKERSKRIISKALAKYPHSLLVQNLRKVYIVESLGYFGVGAGGTNSRDCIYIANSGNERTYTDQYLEECLHHELSSIFLRNYPQQFDQAQWLSANPSGFTYLGTGVAAVKAGVSRTSIATAEPELGFVNEYAKSTMENDFNEIVGFLFFGDQSLWKFAHYEHVRKKIDLTIKFYESLDSSFSEQYFLSQCAGHN